MPRPSPLSLVAAEIHAAKRPDPPDYLEPEAAEEWRHVVEKLPPEWFPPETHAILEDRCRHVVSMRNTAAEIIELRNKKKKSAQEYELYLMLVKMAMAQSRTLATLDSKMRLTQQSSYDKSKRKHSGKFKKTPWQVDPKSRQEEDQEDPE